MTENNEKILKLEDKIKKIETNEALYNKKLQNYKSRKDKLQKQIEKIKTKETKVETETVSDSEVTLDKEI